MSATCTLIRPAILIRAATPADVAIIAHLAGELDREEGYAESLRGTLLDWHKQLFCSGARFTVLLAEYDGEVSGMLIYGEEMIPGLPPAIMKIHDLYVVPARRRRGIARTLLKQVAGFAIARNIVLMHLNVREGNPARAFYGSNGFQHMAQCLTYLIALPAMQQLASTAADLVTSP